MHVLCRLDDAVAGNAMVRYRLQRLNRRKGASPGKFPDAIRAVMRTDRSVNAIQVVTRFNKQEAPVSPSEYWQDEEQRNNLQKISTIRSCIHTRPLPKRAGPVTTSIPTEAKTIRNSRKAMSWAESSSVCHLIETAAHSNPGLKPDKENRFDGHT